MSIDCNTIAAEQRTAEIALVVPGVAFVDRHHHETALGRVDVFRGTIFHLIAVGVSRNSSFQVIESEES